MGSRYYEPGSGRFISPDPYGHEGSIDLYSYANSNPVYYCDADGRFASAVYEQAKEDPIGAMQYGLDVAGMIPIAPDLVNALVHGARGNHIDAMLSLAAAVPIVGDVGRGANIASDAAKMAGKAGEAARTKNIISMTQKVVPDKLYHYTSKANAANILEKGLMPGISGKVFTTPSKSLTPVQAQIELALPSNRGLSGSLLEIDAKALKASGINPNLGPRRVQRTSNAPGGGTEIIFDQQIPPEFIKKIR